MTASHRARTGRGPQRGQPSGQHAKDEGESRWSMMADGVEQGAMVSDT